MYGILASDVKQSVEQFGRVRHALLKLAFCRQLICSEAKKCLSKDNRDTHEAERLISEMHGLVEQCKGTPSHLNVYTAIGLFEMDVVQKVITRGSGTFAFLCHKFISHVNAVADLQLPNRFMAEASAEIEATKEKPASSDVKSDQELFGLV